MLETSTLEVIRGSSWSPAIRMASSAQYRQACSGECPSPTTICQLRPPISSRSPARRRRKLSGWGGMKGSLRRPASIRAMRSSGMPARWWNSTSPSGAGSGRRSPRARMVKNSPWVIHSGMA
jgi:hypothetical protein